MPIFNFYSLARQGNAGGVPGHYARLFLPAYEGGALTVYRGCTVGKEQRMNWTLSETIAASFARNDDYGADRHVVSALAAASAIICDTRPFMQKGAEDEIVVDPTQLTGIEEIAKVSSRARRRPGGRWVSEAVRESFRKEMRDIRKGELHLIGVKY